MGEKLGRKSIGNRETPKHARSGRKEELNYFSVLYGIFGGMGVGGTVILGDCYL